MVHKQSQSVDNTFANLFKSVLWGILSGILAVLIILFIFSLVISKVDIADSVLSVMTTGAVGIGSFVASFISGKILKSKGLIVGAVCAFIFCIIILVLGVSAFSNNFSSLGIIKCVVIVSSSLIGGVSGVNFKIRKKFA